jgi:hypothetical protein
MLEHIDCAFMSLDWEDIYPTYDLQALATSCSDHAPLLLRTDTNHRFKRRFLFRLFRTRCEGFMDVVRRAWSCPLYNSIPFARLDWLFWNIVRFLKSWSDRFVGNMHLQLAMSSEIVASLEAVGDHKSLAPHEEALRKELKLKALGLSSLQRTIA